MTIAKALSEAQSNFKPITRNCSNPYFSSRYADLSAIIDATRPALAAQGIAMYQVIHPDAENAVVETVLSHESGVITSTIKIKPSKADPQGMGSAISYARRYSLSAILGVAAEDDDDGNIASTPVTTKKAEAITTGTLTAKAEDLAGRFAKPDQPDIIGIFVDKKIRTGISKAGRAYTVTEYMIDNEEGKKSFISMFGPTKEVFPGDKLKFTGITVKTFNGNPQVEARELEIIKNAPITESVNPTDLPF